MKKFLSILSLLAFVPLLTAATFNRFTPVTGVLKGAAASSTTTAAASTDITGLWSGTCNSSTFLRGDGSCQAASGTAANPTASVGLTAVNGAASTYLRSDGAPAISQAIVPFWSGQHTYQVSGTVRMNFDATGAPANERIWQIQNATGIFGLATRTDIDGTGNSALLVTRTGTTVNSISLTATTVTAGGLGVARASTGTVMTKMAFGRGSVTATPACNITAAGTYGNVGFTSCTRAALGQANITIAGFTQIPICTANVETPGSGTAMIARVQLSSITQVNIILSDVAAANQDGLFVVTCMGL